MHFEKKNTKGANSNLVDMKLCTEPRSQNFKHKQCKSIKDIYEERQK